MTSRKSGRHNRSAGNVVMSPMSRRTVLRGVLGGAAATVALPMLESMLNTNGTAFADGTLIPRRFGLFYWANGKTWTHSGQPDRWTPGSLGAGWAPGEHLANISAENRAYTNVVTGLEPKTNWEPSPPGQDDGHMRGAAVALSGDRCLPDGFDHPTHTFAFSRATIDQVIATHPQFNAGQPAPRFRSRELGVSQVRFHPYGHWNCISHSGPNMMNLPIQQTGELYETFFGVPPDTQVLASRASILDAVSEDAKRLSARLGKRDKERLDAHLAHIGQINNRLRSSAALCQAPGRPGDYPTPTPSGLLLNKHQDMLNLLAVALQCDLTRVFSIMFTSPATDEVFAEMGANVSMHAHCHQGDYEVVRNIVNFHMQAYNQLLTTLRNTTDPTGGNLLDHSLIYGTSEYGEGNLHSPFEHPVLLSGTAGGGMKPGFHVREPGGNMSKVHTTILRGLGIETPSYGFHGAETSDDLHGAFV